MPFKRYVIIICFILYLQFFLPIEMVFDSFSVQPDYVITFIYVLSGMIFLFYAVPWEYTNYYVRYFYMGLLLLGILTSVTRLIISRELLVFQWDWFSNRKSTIFWAVLFSIIVFKIVKSRMKPKGCIDLEFPFKDGNYLIVEGGDGKTSFFANLSLLVLEIKKISV